MIIDEIKAERLAARKEKDVIRANVLGLLISELDRKQDHSDDAVVKGIKAILKSNEIAISASGDQNLVRECEVLSAFLPKALTSGELRVLVISKCLELGISDMRGMGQIMGYLKKTYSDVMIDGGEVKQYVQEHVANV